MFIFYTYIFNRELIDGIIVVEDVESDSDYSESEEAMRYFTEE